MAATLAEDTERFFGKSGVDANYQDEGESSAEEDSSNIIVRMVNVQKTYLLGIEGVPALRGVSVSIKRGEFVIIYGTSGGGKTSLLNILGTIDKPTKGLVSIDGTIVDQKTSDKVLSGLRLSTIGFVFQTFNLLGSMTALENVMMPMVLQGRLSTSEQRARAEELLESVGMKARMDHFPSMLSGGEQQRVTIARAMANRPGLLLLDEPTGDLDTVNGAIVLKLLCDLNREQGITLVMVTHDVGLKNLADRIIWMRDGKIQRVEVNDPTMQASTRAALDDQVSLLQVDTKGVLQHKQEYKNTDIRPPSFYATLTNVKSAKGKKEYGRRLAAARVTDHDLPQAGGGGGGGGATSGRLKGKAAAVASEGDYTSDDLSSAAQDHEEALMRAARKKAEEEALSAGGE